MHSAAIVRGRAAALAVVLLTTACTSGSDPQPGLPGAGTAPLSEFAGRLSSAQQQLSSAESDGPTTGASVSPETSSERSTGAGSSGTGTSGTGTSGTTGSAAAPTPLNGGDPIPAGTVFAIDRARSRLLVATPNDRKQAVPLTGDPQGVAVAPTGTPAAGTVYIAGAARPEGAADGGKRAADGGKGLLTVVAPDGTRTVLDVSGIAERPLVVPAGSPAAGQVYLPVKSGGDRGCTGVQRLDGDTLTQVELPGCLQSLRLGAAGTENSGSVYITSTSARSRGSSQAALTVLAPNGDRQEVTGDQLLGLWFSGERSGSGTGYVLFRKGSAAVIAVITPEGLVREAQIPALTEDTAVTSLSIAPEGSPAAGSLYGRIGTGETLLTVSPVGRVHTYPVGGNLLVDVLVVVPAGVRGAGRIIASNTSGGTVTVVEPDGRSRSIPAPNVSAVAVAPHDAPNAGTVFLLTSDGSVDTLVMVDPGGGVTTRPLVGPDDVESPHLTGLTVAGNGSVVAIGPSAGNSRSVAATVDPGSGRYTVKTIAGIGPIRTARGSAAAAGTAAAGSSILAGDGGAVRIDRAGTVTALAAESARQVVQLPNGAAVVVGNSTVSAVTPSGSVKTARRAANLLKATADPSWVALGPQRSAAAGWAFLTAGDPGSRWLAVTPQGALQDLPLPEGVSHIDLLPEATRAAIGFVGTSGAAGSGIFRVDPRGRPTRLISLRDLPADDWAVMDAVGAVPTG